MMTKTVNTCWVAECSLSPVPLSYCLNSWICSLSLKAAASCHPLRLLTFSTTLTALKNTAVWLANNASNRIKLQKQSLFEHGCVMSHSTCVCFLSVLSVILFVDSFHCLSLFPLSGWFSFQPSSALSACFYIYRRNIIILKWGYLFAHLWCQRIQWATRGNLFVWYSQWEWVKMVW